jgi:hypothetical protein
VTLFTVIDHAGKAAKAGLSMHPTKVLVFGSPKSGMPLMRGAPSLAIDLLLCPAAALLRDPPIAPRLPEGAQQGLG